MQKLFFEKYKTSEVTNTRSVINTPSAFTRKNFFHIQEAGYLKSLKSHLSRRSELNSYLFFVVLSGSGEVTYREPLSEGGISHQRRMRVTVFFSTVPGNTPTSVRMKIHGNFSGSISTVPRPGHIIPISGITITGISALLISQN